jgi:hypothetical protein
MRNILLGTASALALGLFATSAMAGYDWYGYGKSTTDNTAVAVGVQLNAVENSGKIVIGSQAEEHSKSEESSSSSKGLTTSSASASASASHDANAQGLVTNSNGIEDSFKNSAGLINVNQNNGNNVSQDAQNTVAAILGCDCGNGVGRGGSDTDNVAVAVGLQASYVSNEGGYEGYGQIIVDVATQSNNIKGSFNGAAGLINVNQNNGNNVSQKAQNTVAAIIAKH